MGEYVTTKRSLQQPIPVFKTTVGGEGWSSNYFDQLPVTIPVQETYSFRSTKESDDREALDTSLTRNGFNTYDPQFDTGHTFWTTKQSYAYSAPEFYCRYSYYGDPWFIRSRAVPISIYWGPSYPEVPGLSGNDIVTLGQKAINASSPTRPEVSVAQFVGELSQLPQMLGVAILKDRSHAFLGLGGEYLNIQFGWRPFISDVLKMIKSLKRVNDQILQLQRDNGKNVRRRYYFSPTVTVKEQGMAIGNSPYSASGSSGTFFGQLRGKEVTQTDRTEQSVWFSGCFTYSIPMGSSTLARLERYGALADRLLGTRVTPEVLWELAPWSWLVDWRLGIGDALSTATRLSQDGLVIRYGYLMADTKVTRTLSIPKTTYSSGGFEGSCPPSFTQVVTHRKERVRATPYGFGLNTNAFTDIQWSILGALGMSRAPRVLRMF